SNLVLPTFSASQRHQQHAYSAPARLQRQHAAVFIIGMSHRLHQPCCRAEPQELQPQRGHTLILWNLCRNALIQQAGRICLNGKIRRKIVRRRICRRLCWLRGRLGCWTLRAAKKRKDHEKTNDLCAQKVQTLKNEGSAAPGGPQQAKGSGMSHVTRMGPTPTLTQILSYRADIYWL